jgi:hypothetical protein
MFFVVVVTYPFVAVLQRTGCSVWTAAGSGIGTSGTRYHFKSHPNLTYLSSSVADPDLLGQKLLTIIKKKKFNVLKCWIFSF